MTCAAPPNGKWYRSDVITKTANIAGGIPVPKEFMSEALSWKRPCIDEWVIETVNVGTAGAGGCMARTFAQGLGQLYIKGGDSDVARFNFQSGAHLTLALQQVWGARFSLGLNAAAGAVNRRQLWPLPIQIPLAPQPSALRWPFKEFYEGAQISYGANVNFGTVGVSNVAAGTGMSLIMHVHIVDEAAMAPGDNANTKIRTAWWDTPWTKVSDYYTVNGKLWQATLYAGRDDDDNSVAMSSQTITSNTLGMVVDPDYVLRERYARYAGIRFADPANAAVTEDLVQLGLALPVWSPTTHQSWFEQPDIQGVEGKDVGGQLQIRSSLSVVPGADAQVIFGVIDPRGVACDRAILGMDPAGALVKKADGAVFPAASLTTRERAMLPLVPSSYAAK